MQIKDTAVRLLGKDLSQFFLHSGNYVSAVFFVKGLSIITLPVFTRLLTPKDFGILAILTSFVAILNIIYRVGVQEALMRYYYEQKNDFDRFYGSSFLFITLWAFAVSSLLFVFSGHLVRFFQVPPGIIYIGIGVGLSFVFYGLYEGYLIASKNSRKASWMSVVYNLAIISLAILLIMQLTHDRFYGKAFAILISNLLVGGYSIYFIWKKMTPAFESKHISYALLFGLPLLFHSFSNYFLKSFDIIIINQIVGSEATGLYSVAYRIGMVQAMISLAMLKAWNPMFFDMLNKRQHDTLNNLTSKFASIVYLCAFGLVLFSRELMLLLADKSFHEALHIIPIILMANVFVFLFSIYVNFSLYYKKTTLIAAITLVAAAINIGLNYWLIPLYGYQVAAWTTLGSYFLLFVMHYGSVRFMIRADWITPLRVLLPNFFILLGFVILYLLAGTIENTALYFTVKVCLLIAMAFIYFRKKNQKSEAADPEKRD